MLFNKPHRFEDGSTLAWAHREGLLYCENGGTAFIWVDLGPGWFTRSRVIKTSSLSRWTTTPAGAPDVIDPVLRQRIVAKTQEFFRARGIKATVE